MPLFTTRKPEICHFPVVKAEIPDDEHGFLIFLHTYGDGPVPMIVPIGAKVFEWLDTAGKAHVILCAPTRVFGWWTRIKLQFSSLKGAPVPLGLIVQSCQTIHVKSTVWHQDRLHGRVFLHIEQPPKDVPADSAAGRASMANYTSQNINVPAARLPAGRTPAWMTFKEPPTLDDTVFVAYHTTGPDAYRGSVLVQTKQGSRPRIVGLVDEAYKRSQAPPPGTIDAEWEVIRKKVPFCYCVARPWSAKV